MDFFRKLKKVNSRAARRDRNLKRWQFFNLYDVIYVMTSHDVACDVIPDENDESHQQNCPPRVVVGAVFLTFIT